MSAWGQPARMDAFQTWKMLPSVLVHETWQQNARGVIWPGCNDSASSPANAGRTERSCESRDRTVNILIKSGWYHMISKCGYVKGKKDQRYMQRYIPLGDKILKL